jgi:carbamoyl-phosphate synthase large subunit
VVIAVSGLHRGESPQPGGAVIASIRAHMPDARFVGISYDSMETGIYTQGPDRVDATYLFPYPGAGKEACLARICEVHECEGLSLILPTLDSELENLIALRDELQEMGIVVVVPSAMAFDKRAKTRIDALCAAADVAVPRTFAVNDVATAAQRAFQIGYPCYVKGQLYEAYPVSTEAQLVAAFEKVITTWGAPVLIQEAVTGEEYDIAAVAEEGELIGSITIRKLLRSKMGKGFGGVVVDNPELAEMTRRLLKELAWDGPLEIEVVKPAIGPFVLFEINPRFPAWISFGAAVGVNLPAYSVAHALGVAPPALSDCPPGKMFLRHCEDIVADITQLADLGIDRELTELAPPNSPKDGAVDG